MTEHEKYIARIRSSDASEEQKRKLEECLYDVLLEATNGTRRKLELRELEITTLKEEIIKRDSLINEKNQAISDIYSWSEQAIEECKKEASHDEAGLLRHKDFKRAVQWYIEREKRTHKCAYGLLDLNDFKLVNDRYGHRVGDLVLMSVSKVIDTIYEEHASLRPVDQRHYLERSFFDIGCRLGEEFKFFVPEVNDINACWGLAKRLFKEIESISIPNGPSSLTVSIGVVCVDLPPIDMRRNKDTVEERMYMWADGLMYAAKQYGKSQDNPKPKDFISIKEMHYDGLWREAPIGKNKRRSE